MCSSRQDSDDLLRYRMIEELGAAFGLPGDKIEARSAYSLVIPAWEPLGSCSR